jgi:hypothetical protein
MPIQPPLTLYLHADENDGPLNFGFERLFEERPTGHT